MPDPDQFPDALDSILKKYGKIWIWSILSAAVAALSVRSVNALNMVQLPLLNARGAPPFPPFPSSALSARLHISSSRWECFFRRRPRLCQSGICCNF